MELVENPPPPPVSLYRVLRGESLLGAVLHITGHEVCFFSRPESPLKGDFQEQTLQGSANYIAAAYLIDALY